VFLHLPFLLSGTLDFASSCVDTTFQPSHCHFTLVTFPILALGSHDLGLLRTHSTQYLILYALPLRHELQTLWRQIFCVTHSYISTGYTGSRLHLLAHFHFHIMLNMQICLLIFYVSNDMHIILSRNKIFNHYIIFHQEKIL
jgi:hypothetical protein